MVMMIVSSLLIIGILFSGSVTAEYRAAVYYRQAIQSEQYCIVGLHRAMAEIMYDVWGVYEDRPFVSARYATGADFDIGDPETSLQALGDAAYYDLETGSLKPITRQRSFWNGEAWVVWAGPSAYSGHSSKVTPPAGFTNVWQMDPRPQIHMEIIGGAQRYLSFGSGTSAGTVSTNGTAVTGTGTNFDPSWVDNQEIYIDGALYHIDDPGVNPITATTLKIKEDAGVKTDVGYYVVGQGDCPPSADSPPTFAGGTQEISDFYKTKKGHAADPRWVNPAAFIRYKPADGTAYKYGGVDIDGSGTVDAKDKALRDWALWQLKRDAYLPEAIDNHDLFQGSMHANNRRLWSNGTPVDNGWEFIDPKIVGDSFYQIFRFNPLYSMASSVSDDPSWASGDRFDGNANAEDHTGTKSDAAGYRYPYDRTHLNKWNAVAWADDACGGLVNINQCNNDYNIEQLTSNPGGDATPSDLTWYHYSEAKWIYCYDPLNPEKKYGRYAVSIMPDNGTWNASALHSGNMHVYQPNHSCPHVKNVGDVKAAGGFLGSLRAGFDPKTGDARDAALMPNALNCYSPVRPSPLPHYWSNTTTDGRDVDGDGVTDALTYFCQDGHPDSPAMPPAGRFPVTDYSRAPEIWGGHGGSAWDNDNGVRSAIFNYLIWLGPYDSRAELATHMRKACIAIPSPSPAKHGIDAATRACMETDINNNDADLQKVAQSAMLISALTTVQGFYYTLDRFWDRDLLLVDWSAATSGDPDDMRFSTAQCLRDTPTAFATASARPGQRTRDRYIQVMLDLECFGGYRTRDGKYKLLDYLFQTAAADDSEYDTYKTNHENRTAPAYSKAGVYGGAGDQTAQADPTTWSIQRSTNRIEKFMAMTASRIACQQRGANGKSAACPRGHLVHNPRISSVHRSEWTSPTKTFTNMRTSAADNTLDDIGEGCPVCGGKLFQNAVHEVNIGEIGRFYEKFKNAERPVREAFDVDIPAQKPARNFVELMVYGIPVNGCYIGGSYDIVRFDMLYWHDSKGSYLNFPGVLLDPVTRMPYYTSAKEYGMRHRKPCSDATSINPEPIFKAGARIGMGDSHGFDWRLLVWDNTDNGGRWHDATHCVEYGYGGHGADRKHCVLQDAALYNGAHMLITDDSDPNPANWKYDPDNDLYNALYIRADEKYTMPDPDPAHQQAAAANGFTATVSIYRKMPVRWYGGEAKWVHWLNYETAPSAWYPPGHKDGPPVPPVTSTSAYRGVGFKEKTRLSFSGATIGSWDCDYKYKGDYDDPLNKGGFFHPTGLNPDGSGMSSTQKEGLIHVKAASADNYDLKYPRQYGIITFDGRFDGTKVALVMNSDSDDRPNYGTWQVIDYVELTDSAGNPIRISQACGENGVEGNTVLSWQARNPLDNRSNGDGYMCWDLLPMTLQNATTDGTAGNAPASSANGYDPWNGGSDYKWWGNAEDATFSGFRRITNPNPTGPGFMDMWNPFCNCRNTNTYVRDMPTRRWVWDGTTATSRFSKMADVELGLARTDNGTMGYNNRQPNRKECLMSIPTGIGRQVNRANDANDPAKTATYAGRQHSLAAVSGMTWTGEGNNTNDSRYKWAAYSWDNWADLFKVTDLCQQILWDIYPNTAEDRDVYDGDQDGVTDEHELIDDSLAYEWNGPAVSAVKGHFIGELKQINKLNLNELWYPPSFKGTEWNSSYTSFGRKPLKGFMSPSDAMTYHFYGSANFEARIKPWDLDNDNSADYYSAASTSHQKRFDAIYCSNSTVYTIFVTGNAVDQADEPLAEMRARVTVERTWDGRTNILEFTWLPTDRGLME